MKKKWPPLHLVLSLHYQSSLVPTQEEMCICLFGSNELYTLPCVFVCVCICVRVVSDDAGSSAASVSKCSRINWYLLSYLGPTAVPEIKESDEALFCRVWVTAGAVCTGWVRTQADHRDAHTHIQSSHPVWNDEDKSICPALSVSLAVLLLFLKYSCMLICSLSPPYPPYLGFFLTRCFIFQCEFIK